MLIYRSFLRYKGTFLINLISLSTGLACALLIYLWVNDELNVDRAHGSNPQLFQVMKNEQYGDKGIRTSTVTQGLLAQDLA
ncbi:MAG TPA: hypothetical protein VF646_05215, partial [Cytophagales bacterium]